MEVKRGQKAKGFELAMLRSESINLAVMLLMPSALSSRCLRSVDVCMHDR